MEIKGSKGVKYEEDKTYHAGFASVEESAFGRQQNNEKRKWHLFGI